MRKGLLHEYQTSCVALFFFTGRRKVLKISGRRAKMQTEGRMMYKRKLEEDSCCPLEYGLELFGGKWKSRTICVLAAYRVLRYSELRHEMYNITDEILVTTFKQLIHDGLLVRKSYDEVLPRAEYSLTEKGKSVVPILQSICHWSGAFYKDEMEHPMTQCQKFDFQKNSNFFVFLEGICIPVLNTIHIREETTRNESHTFFRQDLPTKGRDVLWQPSLEVKI